MKASELRIRNFFYRTRGGISMPQGPPIKILTIGFNEVEYCFVDEVPAQIATRQKMETRYLSPIPLTEEWLLKFGFDRPFVPPIYEIVTDSMDKRFRIHKVSDNALYAWQL